MQLLRIFICIISILYFPILSAAQSCGCADNGNCPMQVPANGNTQICYDVTDALNNDLSNPLQGVCGINVVFRHGSVPQQTMTLCAPDGTCVQLTGNSCTPAFTPLATWNILFLPCSETPAPDSDHAPQWENCPTFPFTTPWGNANYSGSYHPFNGCLEDFNSGIVNGQWCLTMNNSAPFNSGNILDFEIILCDDSGIFCCNADAGDLGLVADAEFCESINEIIAKPSPQYGAIIPDPAEYGYYFTVSQNGEIIDYQEDSVTLTGFAAGVYEICGLSYLLTDQSLIPAVNTGISTTDLDINLNGVAPDFCGDISDDCFTITITPPAVPVDSVGIICEGDCLMIGNECFDETGSYTIELTTQNSCDSIVNLNLTVIELDTTFIDTIICAGSSIDIGNNTYATTGNYETLLVASTDCDSTVFLNLTVLAPITKDSTASICQGDAIQIGINTYTSTGIYRDTFPSFAFGCDSIVILDLDVIDLEAVINPVDDLDCFDDEITINGSNSSNGVNITYLWSTDNGNILSNVNQPNIDINEAGTYKLTISNGLCSVSDSVVVNADFEKPTAIIMASNNINCNNPTAILNGASSFPLPGSTLNYNWSSQNSCSVTNPNSDIIAVTCGDTFTLIVESLSNGCTDTTEIEILENTQRPTANAGNDLVLDCLNPCQILDASNSLPNTNLSYSWSTINGNIKSGENTATPAVDDDGIYQLIIEDQFNFCRDTDFVEVIFDTNTPDISFSFLGADELTCNDTLLNLSANDLNNSPNLSYQWSGILAGQGNNEVTVNDTGFVYLILTNTDNNCSDEDSIFISENILPPTAVAADMDTLLLSCVNDTIEIGSENTSLGPDFTYAWTTDVGHFTTNTNILQPSVDSAGIYTLTVTNTLNGCTATDQVILDSNYILPIASIGSDGLIDCQNPAYTFNAFLGSGFTLYEWFLNGEPYATGVNLNSITVSDTGMVVLQTTGQQPFACSVFDTAFVTRLDDAPIVDAGIDTALDCLNGEAILNANNTPLNPNLSFTWSSLSNCNLFNANTLTPIADCIGDYVLEVTDNTTNCAATDTVTVFIDTLACTPMVFAGLDDSLDCNTPVATINANASTGGNFTYQWTLCDGSPLPPNLEPDNIFQPAFTAGCYLFTATNTLFNISATDSLLLIDDRIFPIANAGPDLELTCPELEVCQILDASLSSQGDDFCYSWESLNGEFCGDTTDLNTQVLGEGGYILTVTNKENGCSNTDGMVIAKLGTNPVADAGDNIILECGIEIDTLNGTSSQLPNNTDICWFSNTGTILSGKNTLNPIVEASDSNTDDEFFLVLTNLLNACTDTASTTLQAPDCFPVCEILAPEVLTCEQDTICLEASNSSISNEHCYLWTTLLNGNIVGEDTRSKIQISAAGIYELSVTRKINGAQFTTTCQVQVSADIDPPVAEAGDPQFLTCADTCVTLVGNQSSNNATYAWTTVDGSIKSGLDTNQPLVNAVGTYQLLVTSLANGCTASDFVTVTNDFETAMISAGNNQSLSCSGTVSLFGSSQPSSNALVNIQWTTTNGNILAGGNTLSPIVSSVGTYCLEVRDLSSGCLEVDCVEVLPDNLSISCNILNNDTLYLNCQNTNFQLVAEASTQSGIILSNFWASENNCLNTNVNGFTLDVDCPDTFTFTAQDNNGCLCTRQVTVIDDRLSPIADAGNDFELNCELPIANLDASNSVSQSLDINAGNLIYNWSTASGEIKNGANTSNPLICAAGDYLLTITDATSQCTANDTISVTEFFQYPMINISGDETLTCNRDTATLSSTGSSAGSPFIHCWSSLDGLIIEDSCALEVVINTPGAYILTIQDTTNSCFISDTVTVALDTIAPNILIDQTLPLLVSCNAPVLTLDGNASGATDSLQFSWSSANGNILSPTNSPTIMVDSSGTYLLTIDNQNNGCTDSLAVLVEADFISPDINFVEPPILTCSVPEVTIEVLAPTGEAIYTYQWSAANGAITSNANTATPTVNAAVNYTVTITNTVNGCSNGSSLFVNQNITPPIAIANSLGSLDCIQTTAIVSGDGSSSDAVSYFWTTNTNGNIKNPNDLTTEIDAAGWYYLTVINDENGCDATDSTEVIATAIPIVNANTSLEQPTCLHPTGSISIDSVFGGTPPFVYALNDEVFNSFPQFSFLDIGNYDLLIEDASGCTLPLNFSIEPPTTINLILGPDFEITLGDSATIFAQIDVPIADLDTLIWTPLPNSDCPNCLQQGIRPIETTTYSLLALTNDGCQASDNITILVNGRPTIFAPNIFSPNRDGLNEYFYLQANDNVTIIDNLSIFDRWGNLVFEATDMLPNIESNGWDGLFQGEMMNSQVLIWKATVTFQNNKTEVFHGDVTLIR